MVWTRENKKPQLRLARQLRSYLLRCDSRREDQSHAGLFSCTMSNPCIRDAMLLCRLGNRVNLTLRPIQLSRHYRFTVLPFCQVGRVTHLSLTQILLFTHVEHHTAFSHDRNSCPQCLHILSRIFRLPYVFLCWSTRVSAQLHFGQRTP